MSLQNVGSIIMYSHTLKQIESDCAEGISHTYGNHKIHAVVLLDCIKLTTSLQHKKTLILNKDKTEIKGPEKEYITLDQYLLQKMDRFKCLLVHLRQ